MQKLNRSSQDQKNHSQDQRLTSTAASYHCKVLGSQKNWAALRKLVKRHGFIKVEGPSADDVHRDAMGRNLVTSCCVNTTH